MACIACVGVFVLAVLVALLACRICSLLHQYLGFTEVNLKALAKTDWAAVTGATDGIGKAYAFELAARGFNLLLVSRTDAKLQAVRAQLLQRFPGVLVETLAFDFSESSAQVYERTFAGPLAKVGFLVNNVGHGPDYPERLGTAPGGLPVSRTTSIVNTLPVALLTQLCVPHMVRREGGVIVNISSVGSLRPLPTLAVYSATKAYVNCFTDALRAEYPQLCVQLVQPALVATNMGRTDRRAFNIPTAEKYARSAIRTVGRTARTHGFWGHEPEVALARLLPNWLFNRAVFRVAAIKKAENLAYDAAHRV